MPHRPLVNRQAVRSKFASAGYRTSKEVLQYLDAIVEVAIRSGIRGMTGRARKTVTVEEIGRGRLVSEMKSPGKPSPTRKRSRKVDRGLLRR